jgi:ubiquinone/menaquinone biosynthesis C-methylase UbiE
MNEFEKEYYESPDFWNDGAINDTANLKRVESTIDLIPNDVESLVDIGCGNGVFLNQLLARNKEIRVLGVDRSNAALKHVECDSKIGDIIDIPIESNSYDCVTCLQVLEHIPMRVYNKALDELARISKKYIIIGVPFEEKIDQNMTTCPQCRTVFNVDLHLRSYSIEDVKRLFKDQNFHCKDYINVIETKQYLLLNSFLKLKSCLKGERKQVDFRSPLCPLCGFENTNPESFKPVINQQSKSSSNVKNKIVSFLKFISPTKIKKGYWIMAIYEKNN